MKGAKVNYNSYVKSCPINEKTATIESMRMHIRKARILDQMLEIVNNRT